MHHSGSLPHSHSNDLLGYLYLTVIVYALVFDPLILEPKVSTLVIIPLDI